MNDTAELTFRDVATAAAKPAPEIAAEVVDRADINNGRAVVRYSATEQALAALRERYAGATFDLTTTKGDAAARAARLELTTLRTALEKRRKEFKAPALDFGKLIDSEAARITAEIRKLEDPIDAAIKADEDRREREREAKRQAEAERVAKMELNIRAIDGFLTAAQRPDMTSARVEAGIQLLEKVPVEPEAWADFYDRAVAAKAAALAGMRAELEKLQAREAEAARLEQQRLENERVAAENARVAAELKRQADELAAQKAEAERQAKREVEARLRQQEQTTQPAAQVPVAQHGVAENPAQPQAGISYLSPADAAVASPVAEGVAAPVDATGSDVTEQEIPTLSLSQLSDRLGGLTVTAKLLEGLGFTAHAVKASRLYRPSDFPAICDALIAHIQKARGA